MEQIFTNQPFEAPANMPAIQPEDLRAKAQRAAELMVRLQEDSRQMTPEAALGLPSEELLPD